MPGIRLTSASISAACRQLCIVTTTGCCHLKVVGAEGGLCTHKNHKCFVARFVLISGSPADSHKDALGTLVGRASICDWKSSDYDRGVVIYIAECSTSEQCSLGIHSHFCLIVYENA